MQQSAVVRRGQPAVVCLIQTIIVPIIKRKLKRRRKDKNMEKIVEQGLLYDFYGELLTKHQQRIYEGVVYENLSLGEIAEAEGVSRQAVHDIVKRCDRTLLGYEEKLKLVARFASIKEKISQINELSVSFENGELKDQRLYGSQVRALSDQIMREL